MALDPSRREEAAGTIPGRILVACALRRETDIVRGLLPGNVDFLTTGVGCRRTRKVLTRRFQRGPLPSVLLFTGTAGQLDPSCTMGTVLCPETWRIEDDQPIGRASPELTERLRARGWVIGGHGLTVSLPVLRTSSRLELFHRTGASICDMEAAAALNVAAHFGVPALAPKVVSDAGDSTFLDFYRNLDANLAALGLYLQRLLKELAEIPPSAATVRQQPVSDSGA